MVVSMMRNAPPEIQTSQIRHASDEAINTKATANVHRASVLDSTSTANIEITQASKLTAPRNCIPRIKIRRFCRF